MENKPNADPLDAAQVAALQQQLDEARAERDEWKASSKLFEATAAEAARGLECLSEIDDAWDAFGSAGNRKVLTLAEQIASRERELEAAELTLSKRDAPQAQAIEEPWGYANEHGAVTRFGHHSWLALGHKLTPLYTRPSPPTEAKPVATLVETSIDTMREAADDELRRNGWHKQPNARLALHQVKELMAAFGMHVYRGEVAASRCWWDTCFNNKKE